MMKDQPITAENDTEFPDPVTFGSNSHKAKAEATRDIQRVVRGPVKRRKKTVSSKIASNFLAEDANSVGTYILYDVLIPALKSTLTDIVGTGIERFLYGDGPSPSRRKASGGRGNGSIVQYGSYSSSKSRSSRNSRRETPRTVTAPNQDYSDILLATRPDAETVLNNMLNLLDMYEVVSISDLYDLIGVTPTYVDRNYGWYDLARSSITRVHGGYLLNLPEPVAIT